MNKVALIILFLALIFVVQSDAQTLVSPFAGSETLGEFSTEFISLKMAEQADMKKIFTVEGSLVSHIYRKPVSKSELEVFRSYERELKAVGFKLFSNSDDKRQNGLIVNRLSDSNNNAIRYRKYKSVSKENKTINLGGVASFSIYYLAAKKKLKGKTYYITISISRIDHLYMVDVLEVSDMEADTVKISEELLKTRIESEGRFIIYSIYFDTGKAVILPESDETLETMANYLKKNSNRRFYIVGHTDDTGGLANNMDLSKRRAKAVVEALQNRYNISPNQVEAKGVGPLAPVDTNETDEGKKLNRRVELVLRLN